MSESSMQTHRYRLTRFAGSLLSLVCAMTLSAAPIQSREAARLNNLGTALMNQQLLGPAAEKFAAAYALDPSLTIAKINQGIALLYLQRLPEAQAALEAAAARAPQDPHTWYALGLLYRNENEPHKALDAFNKTLALDPADADTYYFVASIDLELKDLPAAIAEYRRALALNPLHASAQFGLGRCLQREGKTEEARAALATFQHLTAAKLGFPLSHNYGEEGRYAHVEDASLAPSPVAPMIPVSYSEAWRSSVSLPSAGPACILDLNRSLTLVVLSDTDANPGASHDAVRLFRDTSSSGKASFQQLTDTGIDLTGAATACAVGDYDNDGLPDLAVAVKVPGNDDSFEIHLFRNLGNDRFEDVTKAAGLTPSNAVSSLTFVDYDHDGDLDLFVTGGRTAGTHNTLWRNNGNKTFTDWTHQAGVEGAAHTSSAILSDLNNDRAVDLITTGETTTVYTNNREGPFTPSALYSGKLPPTSSVQTLDFNKDGWMDVLLTHAAAPGVTLWLNQDGKSFARVDLPIKGAFSASSAIPIDFDNDGWIDIAAVVQTASGYRIRMLRNLGPGGFEDVSKQIGLDKIELTGPATLLAGDFTHSGAPDLLVTQSNGGLILLRNIGGNKNHSLPIVLKGLADNKSAIGAKVEVFANGLWQKWEVTTPNEILAGLGTSTHADLIRILWPTGVPQDEIVDAAVPLKLPIEEIDRRGSSCPTLFAWDGREYSFVADVIGAAVIGHWTSPTAHNIPDPDEWIKISPNQLREQDGRFSLRFGEPMEEVNFVDQVRLVAIDHPSATSVYPNEGFLSEPPFAQPKIIAATSARALAGAWDDHGNDVSVVLRERDRSYVRDFTNLAFAGFANSHTLTLDLGPWTPDKPLRLLLDGFIEYFSASSMYSAWQAGLKPIPPYIEAQTPDGSWRRVVDDMGFPAGLPRTVVVDLTGKLPAGVSHIRITTNLQIYWDRVQVDNEATDAEPRQTELPLAQARLAFRGYPQQVDGRTPGDLNYIYQHLSETGPFTPHRGAYTRYGDVTPLLRSVDDQFVVFGTGEDMDLEFSASTLPPLPTGWTRDFFFYANGFVKDMDFYEATPFEIGQLPFHGMSGYPYPATEHFPDDPAHTAYQLEYNTRWEPGFSARPWKFDYRPQLSQPETLTRATSP